jgi:hypothetical protein
MSRLPLLQQRLHALVRGPTDGRCWRIDQDARPPPTPQGRRALLRRDAPQHRQLRGEKEVEGGEVARHMSPEVWSGPFHTCLLARGSSDAIVPRSSVTDISDGCSRSHGGGNSLEGNAKLMR